MPRTAVLAGASSAIKRPVAALDQDQPIGPVVTMRDLLSSLMRLILGSGVRLAMCGIGIGMVGAAGLTRLLQSQLFELSPLDPLSFAATGLVMTFVAVAACWVPARRAVKVDPIGALRSE